MADDYGEYEGRPIRKLAIEVRNTAGGLNAAMKVHGALIHPGERHAIVYDVVFEKHRYDPMDDGDAWTLVAIGSASSAAILEEERVHAELEASRAEQRKMADDKNGRSQLDDEEVGLLATAHGLGEHNDSPNADCPLCAEHVEDEDLTSEERAVRDKLANKQSKKPAG